MEFCGSVIESLSMEARMSMCNMSIEAGARAGLVAPDEITFAYCKGKPMAPSEADGGWDKAVAYWKTLTTDRGAVFDKTIIIDGDDILPTVTWGTSPEAGRNPPPWQPRICSGTLVGVLSGRQPAPFSLC